MIHHTIKPSGKTCRDAVAAYLGELSTVCPQLGVALRTGRRRKAFVLEFQRTAPEVDPPEWQDDEDDALENEENEEDVATIERRISRYVTTAQLLSRSEEAASSLLSRMKKPRS